MILSLRTADHTTQAWLYDSVKTSKLIAQDDWESGRRLSEELLSRLVRLTEIAGHTPRDLTGIIIFSGPGSFTSLRIGHAVANALADSLDIPVVGAQGDDWQHHGLAALAKASPGRPALPFYGADAHITKPKS